MKLKSDSLPGPDVLNTLWTEYAQRVEWTWRALHRTTIACAALITAFYLGSRESPPDIVLKGLLWSPGLVSVFGLFAMHRELRSLDHIKPHYLFLRSARVSEFVEPGPDGSCSKNFNRVCYLWGGGVVACTLVHATVVSFA